VEGDVHAAAELEGDGLSGPNGVGPGGRESRGYVGLDRRLERGRRQADDTDRDAKDGKNHDDLHQRECPALRQGLPPRDCAA
jgi:hypothetical protein